MTWRRSAGLIALVSLLAGGCGSGNAERVGGRVLTTGSAGGAPPGARPSALRRPVVHPHRHPPDRRGQLTVQVTRVVPVRASPGGRVVARLLPRTSFHTVTIVPVVAERGDWLGVITAALSNGRIGWIAADTRLVAWRTPWTIVASLRRRQIVVRRDGRVVMRFPVAVGGPSTPTPTGRFAVTDKLLTNDPSSPYGCCILALSAHQPNTPQGWGGGDRIAIHATDFPETIGTAASLGCLRAPAEEARRLVRVIPVGTVVTIRA